MLDKKSNIYSDRPVLQMGGELVGWNLAMGMSPYADRFREYRRFMHRSIGTRKSVESYHDLIGEETSKFLRRVSTGKEEISVEIRKCVFLTHSVVALSYVGLC